MPCPAQPADGASVQHWREGGIARIHFNRPQALNAIDSAVAAGFLRGLTMGLDLAACGRRHSTRAPTIRLPSQPTVSRTPP